MRTKQRMQTWKIEKLTCGGRKSTKTHKKWKFSRLIDLQRQKCIAEEYLSHNLDKYCFQDTGARRRRGFSQAAAHHKDTIKFLGIYFPCIFDLFSMYFFPKLLLAEAASRHLSGLAMLPTLPSQFAVLCDLRPPQVRKICQKKFKIVRARMDQNLWNIDLQRPQVRKKRNF